MPPKRAYHDNDPDYDSKPLASLPPPAKRVKKKKTADDGPVEEKRLARWKASCPKAILDRVERVYAQR